MAETLRDNTFQMELESATENIPTIKRQVEFDCIKNEIAQRVDSSKFDGGIINVVGVQGTGKSVFINYDLIPAIQNEFENLPLTKIDCDQFTEYTRTDPSHFRVQMLLEIMQKTGETTGLSVEEILKSNKHGVLSKWKDANSRLIEVGETKYLDTYTTSKMADNLADVYGAFIQGLANKQMPITVVLDSYDNVNNVEDNWIQTAVVEPTLSTGRFVWVISGCEAVVAKNDKIERNLILQELQPFNIQQASNLLKNGNVAPEVVAITAGHPEATVLVAKDIAAFENIERRIAGVEDLAKEPLHSVLQKTIKRMLDSGRYLGELSEDSKAVMERLAKLSRFGSQTIADLLNQIRAGNNEGGIQANDLLQIITDFKKTGFLKQDATTYTMVEPLKNLILSASVN